MKTVQVLSLWIAFSVSALAEVVVEDRVLQQGVFVDTRNECKPHKNKPIPEECYCKADIHYPVISGMTNPASQEVLNKQFLDAVQAQQCSGDAVTDALLLKKLKDHDGLSTYRSSFKVIHPSKDFLAIEMGSYWYGYRAAHAHLTTSGIIIDLSTNTVMTPGSLFGKNLSQVNKYIYKSLSSMECPTIERNHVFLTKAACKDCSMSFTADGVKVTFEPYSVGCAAMGSPEVIVPAKYVTAPVFQRS